MYINWIFQYLSQNKPANIYLIDRSRLIQIVDLRNLNDGELDASDFSVKAGQLKGVQAILTGQFLDNKIASQNTRKKAKSE